VRHLVSRAAGARHRRPRAVHRRGRRLRRSDDRSAPPAPPASLCRAWRLVERDGAGGVSDVSRRIVLAISGASGAIYGVRTAEILAAAPGIELHLVISRGAA